MFVRRRHLIISLAPASLAPLSCLFVESLFSYLPSPATRACQVIFMLQLRHERLVAFLGAGEMQCKKSNGMIIHQIVIFRTFTPNTLPTSSYAHYYSPDHIKSSTVVHIQDHCSLSLVTQKKTNDSMNHRQHTIGLRSVCHPQGTLQRNTLIEVFY